MIKAIITDIEGTTTSLAFVKDVLFPYARANLAVFVRSQQADLLVKKLLEDTANVVGGRLDTEQAITQLLAWLDADQKITPLKSLQGLIWEAGYQQGAFHGHIYADAAAKLQAWHEQGLALYVYSSGSVQAQKLLYAHTAFGDLTPLFSGYFDTHIGGKRDSASYQAIAASVGLPAAELLFLSDIKEELDAAKAVGWQTVWLVRDGQPDPQAAHQQVVCFDDIKLS